MSSQICRLSISASRAARRALRAHGEPAMHQNVEKEGAYFKLLILLAFPSAPLLSFHSCSLPAGSFHREAAALSEQFFKDGATTPRLEKSLRLLINAGPMFKLLRLMTRLFFRLLPLQTFSLLFRYIFSRSDPLSYLVSPTSRFSLIGRVPSM